MPLGIGQKKAERAAEILPILQAGDPVLREAAQPVDPTLIGTPSLERLIESMVMTMRAAPGVGLAAPQIGLSLRLIVIEDPPMGTETDTEPPEERERTDVPLTVLINPTIELIGDENVSFYEGCLSVSGWAAMTERHREVRVSALDRMGEPIELDWHGWPARILQHELDHLAGVLYIDRMDTKTFATTGNLEATTE